MQSDRRQPVQSLHHRKILAAISENGIDPANCASRVLKQTQLLWDDQVKFSDELRDKRRTYTVSLLLLAGLGVFKSSWPGASSTTECLPLGLRIATVIVVTIAVAAFLFGAYWLFTERATFRVWITNRIKSQSRRRHLRRCFILYSGLTPDQFHRRGARSRPTQTKSRQSASMELSLDEIQEILDAPPEQVDIHLSLKLRIAYEALARANNRVNRRIEASLVWMGVGYLLIAGLFLVYFWWTAV